MNNKTAIIISPNWRDYAKKYLDDCLASIVRQDWIGESKIFLIDNETSDESYQYLQDALKKYSDSIKSAEIIRNRNNDGFARGNNVAMRAALEQGFGYVILFNMDTIVDTSAVSELIKAVQADDKVGVVQARLMLWPEKEKINSIGNSTHFLGFGYCDGYNQDFAGFKLPASNEIFYPSGAAVLFKAETLKRVGLFDEEFWMYNEDQDLGWRVWLAGYKCVLAPKAVVYHKYEFSRSITKYYWMDRNRIIAILKNYHILTLAVILPALIFMEFGLFLFAWKGGWLKEKFRVYGYFLNLPTWRYILKARQEVQKARKIKDRELKELFSSQISYQEIESFALKLANIIFTVYWQIVKRIIVW